MQTNVETLKNCKSVLTLKADTEEWKNRIEKAYNKLESKVSLPGFRKGKAPKELLRSKVNPEDLFNEAINGYLNDNYANAIKDNNLHPIMQPTVDVTKVTYEEFECNITIISEPKVEVGNYKGLVVAKDLVEVSEEEVEASIKKLQENSAEIVVKETGNVVNGDIATIDFEGFVDGVAFEGCKEENYDLEIGSGQFIPGFEDQLVGMNVNETRDINVKFPENYPAENLKGKDATFKVTVKGLKNKVYPEANDDLALDANIDNVETLEQLKNHYKNEILTRKQKTADDAAYTRLVDTIVEGSTIEIADEMIEDEVHHQLDRIEAQAKQYNLDLDTFLSFSGTNKEGYLTQTRTNVEKNLKGIFTILAVAKKENIEVTEEDLNKAYQDMANQYKMPLEDVKKALSNRVEALANDLLMQKVSEFLKKENNI